MNINMIDISEKSNPMMEKTKHVSQSPDNARMADMMTGYSLDITGKVMENAAYDKDDLLSVDELKTKASLTDVPQQRNYMAVMSNSMSEDDFSELLKEGYNPTHTEIEESVTSLDKLKAKMAETGQVIEGFNDDLSSEDVKKALNIGSAIMPLTDDSLSYMISNEMEPTLSNLYKAEHSSDAATHSLYKMEVERTEAAWNDIQAQAVKIIEAAGIEITDESIENAKWLVENQIPLNEETLNNLEQLKSLNLPASEDTILSAINVALEEGKAAEDANLLKTESIYKKAVDIINDFAKAEDGGDITRRRQLEEVRLSMTVEANIALLRKGISIDTSDLENLVETLKKAEEEFYRPLLGMQDKNQEDSSIRAKIDLYKETTLTVESLREAPIQSVGDLLETKSELNLRNLKITSDYISSEYENAGRRYETMMSTPRADLGDSITKAFRNVDDILSDLKLPLSEDNRRAIRIMGYSQIQITRESVEEVREAARAVSNVIELMSPAKTLQMIRDGHNPLTENIFELEKSLKNNSELESSEKYSEFLMKLERRGEITDDEKSAFIGMYRLFDKIERQDSRVIGRVLEQGEDLNLKNLLTAYRSKKFGGLDLKIDDEFGLLENVIAKGESITDQLEKGFNSINSENTPNEYIKEKLSDINSASLEETATELLKEIDVPVNVENILAASDFAKSNRKQFKILGERTDNIEEETSKKSILDAAKDLASDFAEGEDVQKSYDDFSNTVSEESKEMMLKAQSHEDVREWARLNRQIEISRNLAKTDEYYVPVETEDGFISIRLKIKQTGDGEGRVDASFTTDQFGDIKASFSVNIDDVTGIISARYEGGLSLIREKEEELRNALSKQGFNAKNISYVRADGSREMGLSQGNATNRKLFKVAGVFLKAMEKGVTQYEN